MQADDGEVGTKGRILAASAELFSRQGYAATGIKAILGASDAPYASLYHFFPGGKEELGAAAIGLSGEGYRQLVESVYDNDTDPVAATRGFFDGAALLLEHSDFADACPIAVIALEVANTSELMREAAAAAFDSWLVVVRDRLVRAGIAPERAYELAVVVFCAMEGAFILCRTKRDAQPMRIAGDVASTAIAQALAAEDVSRKRRPTRGAPRKLAERADRPSPRHPHS